MQALKIKFEVTNGDNYHPGFVEKIMESRRQIAEGKFIDVKQESLKSFIDGLSRDPFTGNWKT